MPGSDPNTSHTSPVMDKARPESWACDPMSPRSRETSVSHSLHSGSTEKKVKHRPSLSKFSFPARLSEPPPVRPEFFSQPFDNNPNDPVSPNSRPTSRQALELGPNEVGLGLSEGDMLPRPASTGDLAGENGGEIQFRTPFRRPSVRTLYSSGLVQTSRFAANPGYGSRKASMVNPEDYRPGMSSNGHAGKAVAAGFEPPLPSDITSRILEARASLANERKASWYPITDLNDSSSGTSDSDRARNILSQHFGDDTDLGEMTFETPRDNDDHEWDSPTEREKDTMPTMYSNTFLGPVSTPSEEKSQPFDRRPSTVPRDPVTGKVDWRARLQMKPRNSIRSSISLEAGSEKGSSPFDSNGTSPMSEKYSAEKFMPAKPSPAIVALDNEKYTPLGKTLLRLSPITFLISFAATNFYLYTRAQSIIRAHNTTGDMYISAWLFYAFEWVFALWTGARAVYKLFSMNLQAKPRLLLKHDFALPNVDVLVMATGQDPGMVMDAVVSAARLDWPVDKLRVLVIDESRSEILKYQVEQYSNLRAIYVTYHQRSPYAKTPRGGVWPKSSTINLGLSETRAEGRVAGQYAVILEAESIAEPGMLRALLPHMINDPLLALVQSPSAFYNLPKQLSTSFSTFLNFVEPAEASRSAFAVRRSAIDDIGGLPTRSSVEDRRLDLLLKGKGYSTLFLDEALAFSLVPDSFSKHLRQGVERKLAHFKTAARFGFFVFSLQIAHLSFKERLQGLGRAMAPFFSIIVALASIALPVSLALGGFLVPALSIGDLNFMLWAALAMILAEKLHDFCSNMPNGDASARGFVRSEVFKAPYLILGLVRSMIPSFLCRAPQSYWQSQQPGERLERNPKYRTSFMKRLVSVTVGTHGWTHLLLVLGLLGAIGYSLYNSTVAFAQGQRGLHQTALYILMTVGWPTLPWMDLFLGCFTPFRYAIRPPAVPSREALLNREPISGRATPLESAKSMRPFRTAFWGQAFISFLLVGYACAVFSLTFVDLHIK